MSIQKFILDTVAASAADLTTPGGGKVLVTGDSQGFLRNKVQSMSINYFNPEVLENVRVVGTPAANTSYEFSIEQEVGGEIVESFIAFTSVLLPTDVQLGAALTAAVQSYIDSGQLKAAAVAYASTTGGVDIVALTGYATLRVIQLNNVTQSSLLQTAASTATDFSGTAATGVIISEVASTTGVAVGQEHFITWTGNTETINGSLGTAGTKVRVAALLSTPARIQYNVDELSGDFTGDNSVYLLTATDTRVSGDVLIAAGVTAATSGNIYDEVIVVCESESGKNLTVPSNEQFVKHYYINSGDTADALALMARFAEVKAYHGPGVTTADPLLL